ncbi:MAG: hypothetical protein MNPFHGCM_02275 [Gemmatimonadaceae bacterium]|nr:hypothetical protein [Gemmatimonadaceae bacterium]
MDTLPWELHAATALEGLIPLFVWLRSRLAKTEISRPRRLVMAWLLVQFTSDLFQLYTMSRGISNLWARYLISPTSDVLMLYALSMWQTHPLRRIGIRVAMLVLVPVWFGYAIAEGVGAFGRYSDPLRSIVILVATLVTLVGNGLTTTTRISRHDWFWVAAGVALYFALEAALGPFLEFIFADSRDIALRAFLFKARFDILAYLLIAAGLLCPQETARPSGTSI